jgi:hypothetical protein
MQTMKANGKRCGLCRGKKEPKNVVAVKSPAFTGEVCTDHLMILLEQEQKPQPEWADAAPPGSR